MGFLARMQANRLWDSWVTEWEDWERLYGCSQEADQDFFVWFAENYHCRQAVVDELRAMTVLGDRDATLQQWADQLARQQLADRLVAATSSAMATQQGIALFDWNDLCTKPDDYPHMAILGSTGSGKTVLTEWLLHQLPGASRVITTKRRPNQWRGLEVVGTPRDFPAIEEGLQQLVATMDRRTAQLESMTSGDFAPYNVAIDEFPAIAANIKNVQRWITTLLREARETRIRLLLLLQGQQVKTLGLEGQSDLKDCMTFIRLGTFAVKHAKAVLSPEQAEWVAAQRYPCMVNDTPATVPDLSNWEPVAAPKQPEMQKPSETARTSTPSDVSPSLARFGIEQLPAKEAQTRIAEMRNAGMNQTQIILAFWGARPGSNTAYTRAVADYRFLS